VVQQWEYVTKVTVRAEMDKMLAAAGTHGWELVGFSIEDWNPYGSAVKYRLIFKRPEELPAASRVAVAAEQEAQSRHNGA
jgi:hypothetical protein